MSRALAIGAALLAIGLNGPAGPARAADPPAKASEGAEFTNKFLAINYRLGLEHSSGLFKGVATRKLADRTFLVGEVAYFDGDEDEEDWRGVAIWIPADQVESIMIFGDLEKAHRVARKARDARKAREATYPPPPPPGDLPVPAPDPGPVPKPGDPGVIPRPDGRTGR